MKQRKQNEKKLSLKKLQITKITKPNSIKGGDVDYKTDNTATYPTAKTHD